MENNKLKVKLSKQEIDLLTVISDRLTYDCKCDKCLNHIINPFYLKQQITEIYINGFKLTSLPHEENTYYYESSDYWVRKNKI